MIQHFTNVSVDIGQIKIINHFVTRIKDVGQTKDALKSATIKINTYKYNLYNNVKWQKINLIN